MTVYFITHPEVVIEPTVPVPDWHLSPRGVSRMTAFCDLPFVAGVKTIASSRERKARDGAEILAVFLRLSVTVLDALGENDRSATGFLPPAEFQATADDFFARPNESVRGWERAVDARDRIVACVARLLASGVKDDVAIVSHGGVGTLLFSHLIGDPISRRYEQPSDGGGNYFAFERSSSRVLHRWRDIAALPERQ